MEGKETLMFFEGRLVFWLMVVLDVGLGRATGTLKRRLRCVALPESAGEQASPACRFLCSVGTVSFHLPIQSSAIELGQTEEQGKLFRWVGLNIK